MPLFTSVICFCCSVASLSSTIAITLFNSFRMILPRPRLLAVKRVSNDKLLLSARSSSFVNVSGVIRGTSPYKTITVLFGSSVLSDEMAF